MHLRYHRPAPPLPDGSPPTATVKVLYPSQHVKILTFDWQELNIPTSDWQELKILTSDVTKGYTSVEKKCNYFKGLNMEQMASSERRIVYLELMTRLTTALAISERTTY